MENKVPISLMKEEWTHTTVRGETLRVQAVLVNDHKIVVTGGLLKTATVLDESFIEDEVLPDPRAIIPNLIESRLRIDILSFAQKLYEKTPKHSFPFEWDNAAVAASDHFTEWWEQLPQETRKNVRRATKRGVIVQLARFDENFIKGIKEIYDEMPVRGGRRFWHFGKDLETVKRENGTYLDRSEFIGAYYKGELIGFMKFVRVGRIAIIMQILSKTAHCDKRPMNALIAKAVEVCHARGLSYLVYGKFAYGNKTQSELVEFKRRNGFVQMKFPRYFIPLTLKGRLAVRLKLHRGLLGILPSWLIRWLGQGRRVALLLINRATNARRRAEFGSEAR